MLIMALQLISANFIRQLENQTIENFESQLDLRYEFFKSNIESIVLSDQTQAKKEEAIYQVLQDSNTTDNVSITVIDRQGYILGTNDQTKQGSVGTKSTDLGVQQASLINSNVATYQYVDETHHNRQMRLIGPVGLGENRVPEAVIVIDGDVESQYDQVQSIALIFLNASLVAIAITMVVAILISRGITKPIADMYEQTEKISEGNYSGSVKIYGEDELGQLGEAINLLSVKIRDAQESSESERQRLDSVLRHMSDGVMATDRRGRIVIVNDAALDLLNCTEEDVLGESILEVLSFPKTHSFRILLANQEQKIITMNDSVIKCDFSVIQRDSGFISGLICVLSDITEQEKIEEERRSFVSNVSHELRTPLTSIRSYTEALRDGAWQDKDVAPEFLSVIQTETNRMIRMISDLLNLSRMDQEKMALEKEFVNMNDLFNHILNRFDQIIKDEAYRTRNYTIIRDFTQTDLWVEVDQDKITQVIDNILNNAIKYSPDGGQITCRLMETHDSILISISDQGMGVPRRAIPKLFDRFYRVDKARSRAMGGTGLGLAISKEVVELHGGKIWVVSAENEGSTFFVSLPYVPFEESGEFE